ncbi:hypothetical protein ACNFRX_03475 [Streptomyces griseoaurantiacus]
MSRAVRRPPPPGSVVHLEMCDPYDIDYERGPFADWRAGYRYNPENRSP